MLFIHNIQVTFSGRKIETGWGNWHNGVIILLTISGFVAVLAIKIQTL